MAGLAAVGVLVGAGGLGAVAGAGVPVVGVGAVTGIAGDGMPVARTEVPVGACAGA
ncbi:hypothetical protein ACFRJ7_32970 [Streptomyces sp. NPDC056747]|uniref:hypothetical protein n=1 Tax=Streptomyces sp. NPDC056747 TaxID=3345935 RepID=UPI00367F7A1A